jgi:hypothetical protein
VSRLRAADAGPTRDATSGWVVEKRLKLKKRMQRVERSVASNDSSGPIGNPDSIEVNEIIHKLMESEDRAVTTHVYRITLKSATIVHSQSSSDRRLECV